LIRDPFPYILIGKNTFAGRIPPCAGTPEGLAGNAQTFLRFSGKEEANDSHAPSRYTLCASGANDHATDGQNPAVCIEVNMKLID
jgi:hypothetical protein